MKSKLLLLLVTIVLLCSGQAGAQQWTPVGSAAFSAGRVIQTSMAIGKNDTPYIAYLDQANNDAVSVMKYNGSSWVYVGSPGFSHTVLNWSSGQGAVISLILKVDTSGKPYVFFMDSVSPPFSLMTYNGSNWVYIDSAGIVTTQGQPANISMDLDQGGTPYIAFVDYNHSYAVSVMKHTAAGWAFVGPQKFTPGSAAFISLAIDHTGTPWVAFGDGNVRGDISVQKFNGSNWIIQGAEGFSYGQYGVYCTSLTFNNNNTAYVAYEDDATGDKITVKNFTSGTWSAVGDTAFSAGRAFYINLKVTSGGVPVVAFEDQNSSSKATVKYFNGATWADLGTPDFSGGQADWVSLAVSSRGLPYVGFEDAVNGHTASVYSFGVPASINEVNEADQIKVYPNPNNGNFSIKISDKDASEMSLALYDIVGQQVWQSAVAAVNPDYNTSIHANDLPKGTYFLRVKSSNGISTQKIEIMK